MNLELPDLLLPKIVAKMTYLGFVFNKDLNWNDHFARIVSICSSRLYALSILKDIVLKKDLISIYFSLCRSICEYATPVFCHITSDQLALLNGIQHRAHNIICFFNCHCNILPEIVCRRNKLILDCFRNIVNNVEHPLHKVIRDTFLPSGRIRLDNIKTARRMNSFFPWTSIVYNDCLKLKQL